ncbi:UNVERIFIED_CONTAM: hypothetical protein H355_011178 [Colinus virginianus]|nr:hypothetical protein H355_011178 [Colinus virginianus]
MGWSCSLLLLLLPAGLPSALALLQYRYDCGEFGMQLLAYPTRGRSVRFKVLDEFGTRFEVANCSICLHWLNTGEDGGLVFSAGYEGCHVLVKDGRYVLRVQLEEMLLSGVVAASYEVNMTCPQPTSYEILRDENVRGHHQPVRGDGALPSHGVDVLIPPPRPGLLQHIAHSALAVPRPQLPPRAPVEQGHPVAHAQPVLVHPELQRQPQPGMGHSRPQTQNQPGLIHAGGQTQTGLLRPGLQTQNQHGMVHAGGEPLTREQCQVAVGRLPCVSPPGRDACLQAGCCFDDTDRATPCYYGNTATVQCLPEGHFVLVVPRGLSAQLYNLDSVRLASAQPGCQPTQATETFVLFHFPVTQCGTTVQVIEDRLVYENQLISTIDVQSGPRGSVTRDSVYILHARCIYNASELLPLSLEVAVPPTAAPLAQPGPLQLQLRIATDESYSSYHPDADYPLVKVLRDPIYVEVRLLQKTDPNLVLVLHQCWAAPSTSPAAEPQWPILVDGCPFAGDNYRTQMVPVGPATPQLPFPSHYQRFAISTFAFVDTPSTAVLEGEVYILCSASVCHLSQPEPCRPSCQVAVPSRARRAAGDKETADSSATVTSRGRIVVPKGAVVGRH